MTALLSPDDHRLLPPDATLFDFVDPFADIDLLVPSREVWPRLATAIASALSWAGFFRWEIATFKQAEEDSPYFENIPIDRFQFLFEPSKEPQLLHLDGDPEPHLRRLRTGTLSAISEVGNEGPRTEAMSALLTTWLKLVRYASQFDALDAPDAEAFLARARTEFIALGRENAMAAFHGARGRRIEFQVMDALFSAVDLRPALELMIQIQDFLPQRIGDEPFMPWLAPLVRDLRGTADPASFIAAVVVPATSANPPRPTVFTAGEVSSPNVTPWIPIGTGGISTADGGPCCPEASPAPIVVALRGGGLEQERLRDYPLQRLNVEARFQLRHPYGAEERWSTFGVPAIYSVGASTMMRVDPQYLREALGSDARIEVALKHHGGDQEASLAPEPGPEPETPQWLTNDLSIDPRLGRIPV